MRFCRPPSPILGADTRILIPAVLIGSAVILGGCGSADHDVAPLPHGSFDPDMVFPTDRSLTRPEDGVVLAETMASRVWRFRLDVMAGQVSGQTVALEVNPRTIWNSTVTVASGSLVRIREDAPWLDLMARGLVGARPWLITGMILSLDNGPVYVTGLGYALVRLRRSQK